MGYFPNGTTGELFEAEYCERCIHQGDEDDSPCPVMTAHMLYNYDQLDDGKEDLKDVLDMLIPREGVHNGQCRMFRAREAAPTAIAANAARTDR